MVQNRIPLILLGLLTWALIVASVASPIDFRSFYAAGELLRAHPAALYSLPAQQAAQHATGSTVFLPWAHLAIEALLFAPLSLLTWRHAYSVWTALSIGLLLVAGALLREDVRPLRPVDRLALAAAVFVPAMIGLLIGQDHALVLLLWVLAWRKWRDGHRFAAGVFIGISLIRYQFAIPFLLCLLVLRKWETLRGALLSGTSMLLASWLLVGSNMIPSYLRLLRMLAASDTAAVQRMPTIRGFANLILPVHADIAAGVAIAILMVWALIAIRRLDDAGAFAFAMIVSLLADFHGFRQDLTLLAIRASVLLRKSSRFAVLLWCVVPLNLIGAFVFKAPALMCPVLLAWAVWAARFSIARETPRQQNEQSPDPLPQDSSLPITVQR